MIASYQTEAAAAVAALLEGSPWEGAPDQCGPFAEIVAEMMNAGGCEGARKVFAIYAQYDPAVAKLRSGQLCKATDSRSLSDLLKSKFPEPRWAIPNILPVGLGFLAGRPKMGKSWLALQTAVAVGSGGVVLDQWVEKGKVLYLALEDSGRRLQGRLRKQGATDTTDVDFAFEWESLAVDGTQRLAAAIESRGYSLVVIDTFSRAAGRADQMDLAVMTTVVGTLQSLAMEKNVTILLVDHQRKSAGLGGGDPVDDVMGSTGKAGVADAVLGLYRERGRTDATLKVTGRDVDEHELSIRFDAQTGCWQCAEAAIGVRVDTVQASILSALEELDSEATAAEIARHLGKHPSNITRELAELLSKGAIEKCGKRGVSQPYRLVPSEE